jgi:hypothetical protein
MITYDFVFTALQARLKLKISGPIRLMRSGICRPRSVERPTNNTLSCLNGTMPVPNASSFGLLALDMRSRFALN